MVLAGPGSGKTRVITRRIANMIEHGIDPRRILAITFTNKAANEMAERVERLAPGMRVWVSTFHRFCARLLRERAEGVGLQPNFSIYDTGDQQQIVRHALNELDLDAVHFSPSRVLHRISRAKNDLITAERFALEHADAVGTHWDAVVTKVYPLYQKKMLEANAVDFDDLLLHVVQLLTDHSELRELFGERFRYILVDEYQDTNAAQYQIVAALAAGHRNLCVTGDPDQSIYGWRGARIENILRFEKDFPNAKIVRLEQNFRSVKEILLVADSLIVHNVHRKAKELITENPQGEPVELLFCEDGKQEAETIAKTVREIAEAEKRPWSDFAIFYRVNALSRELEQAFTRERIPLQVAAGVAFYERAEIKDTLSFLHLVHNPSDTVAFRRIVNKPARGLGKTSLNRLINWAEQQEITLLEAAGRAKEHPRLTKRAVRSFQLFAEMIEEFMDLAVGPVETLLVRVLERTSYLDLYQGSENEDDQQRLANVQELLTAARQYDLSMGEEGSLENFLEVTSLVNEVDSLDESAGAVTLMTLHAAKGLEFPVAFIVGVEQNLLPHERSLQEDNNGRAIEEERRLFFVGITRAEERLFLTHTRQRDFRGRRLMTIRSQFLSEIDVKERSLAEQPRQFLFDDFPDEEYSQDVPTDDFVEKPAETKSEETQTESDSSEPAKPKPNPKPKPEPKKKLPKLMTGSQLLASGSESQPRFTVGQQVRHPQYGLGTVTKADGGGRWGKVTIEFDDGRVQSFVATKCPLQPVGMG